MRRLTLITLFDNLQADPSAKALRNKSWPYYEDWKVVFGKDRATGLEAADTEHANNFYIPNPQSEDIGSDTGTNFEGDEAYEEVGGNERPIPADDVIPDTVFTAAAKAQDTSIPKKKRGRGDALDGLVAVIGKMHEDTNARLKYLSTRIGYEFDVTKARKELYLLMGEVPGLTLSQVFMASDAILAKGERLDYFMSLPEHARHAYVWHVLDNYLVK